MKFICLLLCAAVLLLLLSKKAISHHSTADVLNHVTANERIDVVRTDTSFLLPVPATMLPCLAPIAAQTTLFWRKEGSLVGRDSRVFLRVGQIGARLVCQFRMWVNMQYPFRLGKKLKGQCSICVVELATGRRGVAGECQRS